MKVLTEKQKLALSRGSALRSMLGVKGMMLYLYANKDLTIEEWLILGKINRLCDDFYRGFQENNVKMGLKRKMFKSGYTKI